MTETMTEPVATNTNPKPNDKDGISPPCPCGRPMDFTIEQTWRCLACNPIPLDAPICATQKCKKPLTRLGDPWNCWICLRCNDHPKVVNKRVKQEEERKRIYLDKKLTTEDVSKMIKKEMAGVGNMIRETMAEFLPKPGYPPTHAEIDKIAEEAGVGGEVIVTKVGDGIDKVVTVKPETYLQKAKRLGIATHIPTGGMRKKAEIMADIATKETAKPKLMAKEKEKIKAAQSPPGENDEFARGLTEEDMM